MTERGLPLGLSNQKIFQNDPGEKINHKRRPLQKNKALDGSNH